MVTEIGKMLGKMCIRDSQSGIPSAPSQNLLGAADGAGLDGLTARESFQFVGHCRRGVIPLLRSLLQTAEHLSLIHI